jgi:hypothetical protein
MELNSPEIAAKMGLPAENFAPGYMYQSVSEQDINYQNLLLHIFHEIKSLGFKIIVVGAGHYPLLPRAEAIVEAVRVKVVELKEVVGI